MRFAQFYTLSTGYVGGTIPPRFDPAYVRPIPACGSDAVMRLDGRLSLSNMAARARETCKQRGYVGFSIECGHNYSQARTLRAMEIVQ